MGHDTGIDSGPQPFSLIARRPPFHGAARFPPRSRKAKTAAITQELLHRRRLKINEIQEEADPEGACEFRG